MANAAVLAEDRRCSQCVLAGRARSRRSDGSGHLKQFSAEKGIKISVKVAARRHPKSIRLSNRRADQPSKQRRVRRVCKSIALFCVRPEGLKVAAVNRVLPFRTAIRNSETCTFREASKL